jgi:cbb3-type cytochrome oxidase maturation protein
MNIVFLLIPMGIVLIAAAAAALIWAVDSGQYDGDVEENGRIALELDPPRDSASAR